MKSITHQNSALQNASVLFKALVSTAAAGLIGVSLPHAAIALSSTATPVSQPESPILIATAYTDITLPTLSRGDRGNSVRLLQQILLDDVFLHAAGARLGNPSGAVVDGVFGPITESAVKDFQQRYNVPVTGRVNPRTWEALDVYENPYQAPLPWKL